MHHCDIYFIIDYPKPSIQADEGLYLYVWDNGVTLHRPAGMGALGTYAHPLLFA